MNPSFDEILNGFKKSNPESYDVKVKLFFSKLYRDEVDVNIVDDSGMTILHHLAEGNFEFQVYELLRHKANVNLVDDKGRTPLHLAASNGFQHLIMLFIYFNADFSIRNQDGNTALHLIAKSNNLTSLAALLMAAYDQNPAILDYQNNQKKRFNDFFSSTLQVHIFNRFKSLKKIKTFRNESLQLDSMIKRCDDDIFFNALIALEDVETVEICKKECKEKDLKLNLIIMRPNSKSKILKQLKSKPNLFIFTRYTKYQEEDFKNISPLELFKARSDGFSLFNYYCCDCDSNYIEKLINYYGESCLMQPYPDLICSNSASLKRFHPKLADKYLPYTSFNLKDLQAFSENCPICKNPSNSLGDKWIRLKCTHLFHEDCLHEWLPYQKTCPMCRRNINFLLQIKNHY